MLGTKKVRDSLKQWDIVQINPKAELGLPVSGMLGIVAFVHSWGVDLFIADGGTIPVAWEHVELTGGRCVWDNAGEKLGEPEPTLRHHP